MTQQEWLDYLYDQRDNKPELTEMNSSSNTAFWRALMYIYSVAAAFLDGLWNQFKAEMEVLISGKEYAIASWYVEKLKAFQYGDELVLIKNKYQYAVIDPTKQIITRAAVQEKPEGGLIIKIAKESGPLTVDELNAAIAYLKRIKPPGINLTSISLNADLLRVTSGTFYYNAIHPLTDVKADLDNKIDAYLTALPFDGQVRKKAYEDAMQSTLGYHDHTDIVLEASDASGANFSAVSREYNPLAGYIEMQNPLSTQLIFVPVTNV